MIVVSIPDQAVHVDRGGIRIGVSTLSTTRIHVSIRSSLAP
jgi:hypothetical protein